MPDSCVTVCRKRRKASNSLLDLQEIIRNLSPPSPVPSMHPAPNAMADEDLRGWLDAEAWSSMQQAHALQQQAPTLQQQHTPTSFQQVLNDERRSPDLRPIAARNELAADTIISEKAAPVQEPASSLSGNRPPEGILAEGQQDANMSEEAAAPEGQESGAEGSPSTQVATTAGRAGSAARQTESGSSGGLSSDGDSEAEVTEEFSDITWQLMEEGGIFEMPIQVGVELCVA